MNLRLIFPLALLALAGCSAITSPTPLTVGGLSIQGKVHGGQQPVNGAHVYLMSAGTAGYGQASTSLLAAGSTGLSDSVGAYVTTAPDGSFSITGDYTCTANTQAYLYVLGGDTGGGPNSASGFLAALGNCPNTGSYAAQTPYIWINEMSTVAAAYAMAPFAIDATHVSSAGDALSSLDIANAFTTPGNLEDLPSGNPLSTTPAGNGVVPQATIITLANILASCINSADTTPGVTLSDACNTLFSYATSDGTVSGTLATDTATAAINIAHHPGANVTNLFDSIPPQAAFQGGLATQPPDFTLAVTYTGAGINGLQNLAIDPVGSVWVTDNAGYVDKLSTLGVPISPSTGYTDPNLSSPYAIASDTVGNIWVTNPNGTQPLVEFATNGTVSSLTDVENYVAAYAITFDNLGNILVPSSTHKTIYRFDSAGNPTTDFTTPFFMDGLAADGNGVLWSTNDASSTMTNFSASDGTVGNSAIAGGAMDAGPVVIGANDTVWTLNGNGSLGVLDANGGPLFTASAGANGNHFAIDGAGSAWVGTNVQMGEGPATYSIANISSSGTLLSGGGYQAITANSLSDIAIDGSGNVWLATGSFLTEVIGVAAPTITPTATATANNTTGNLPGTTATGPTLRHRQSVPRR